MNTDTSSITGIIIIIFCIALALATILMPFYVIAINENLKRIAKAQKEYLEHLRAIRAYFDTGR